MSWRRGDDPEPAPKAFLDLGPAPGYKVVRFPTQIALDTYLRTNHVNANDQFNRRMFQGGVVPSKMEVALLEDGRLNDPGLEQRIAQHEYVHTYGVEHRDGEGWFTPDGKRFDDLPEADQTAYIDRIRNPPPAAPTYDWNKAFAKAPAADPAAAAVQLAKAMTTKPDADPSSRAGTQ